MLEPGITSAAWRPADFPAQISAKKEVNGGDALEFYWRVGRKYEIGRFAQDVAWFYEPKVGEQVFREMLEEVKVRVLLPHRLREKTGVTNSGAKPSSIMMEDRAAFAATIFADYSYEGDLMAQAGVPYTVGREAASQYGESLAGVRDRTPLHQFLVRVSPFDASGKLLPEVDSGTKAPAGSPDKKGPGLQLPDDPVRRFGQPSPLSEAAPL